MTAPPTWRDLGRRAARLGMTLHYGDHAAWLWLDEVQTFSAESWYGHRRDRAILRAAVAAALEQMGARR